jgi:hypothetical protein
MINARSTGGDPTDIQAGNRCMLSVGGRQFLVEILELQADTMHVSFPLGNFPLGGMRVELEFHDMSGYTQYDTVVVSGPSKVDDGIILGRPMASRRNQHRSSLRVPTDLTAQAKDQVHVRRYDAAVLDISEGGLLIRSEAPFDMETTIEVTLSLPGESVHVFLGQVVHMNQIEIDSGEEMRLFGMRFLTTDPQAAQALKRYIQQRLKELHAEG